jgi:hypothetical protein
MDLWICIGSGSNGSGSGSMVLDLIDLDLIDLDLMDLCFCHTGVLHRMCRLTY